MSGRAVAMASPPPTRRAAAALGDDAEGDQPRGDDEIDHGENENREPDPRARFHVAIDFAAIEKRTQSPTAPRFGRSRCGQLCRRFDGRNCRLRRLRAILRVRRWMPARRRERM